MKTLIRPNATPCSYQISPEKSLVDLRETGRWRSLFMANVFALLLLPAWSDGAQKAWNGAAGDTFWSTPGNWATPGVPGSTDNVTFTNEGATDTPYFMGGVINVVVDAGVSGSINSLGFRNIAGVHNVSLVNPLVVQGTSGSDVAFIADDGQPAVLFVGSGQADAAADVVYTSIFGDSLTVSNVNANLSVMQGSVTAGSHWATLDLSGLNTFTCVVSNVLVAHDFGQPVMRPNGTLILAANNSITARLISLSDAFMNAGSGGAGSRIFLGQANTLNVDRIRVALHKCVGTISFIQGLVAPTVTFRSASGSGRQISWEVGDEYEPDETLGYFTSSQAIGVVDLTGGIVDAQVDRITLGRGQTNAPTRTGDGNGTLTFGAGSIDANYLEMGIQLSDGGSAGRGVLNVNRDDTVIPALFTLNGNLVMAVQRPGNSEPTGSTADINLNGGTLEVAGDIIDGAGRSTINIVNGGTLDLQPTGDLTPGDISVDTLNINDGFLVHYRTLSVSAIALAGLVTQFTVEPDQTLAAVAPGRIGILNVTGDLILRGTTEMEISDGVRAADEIAVSGTLDLGGTLKVKLSGHPTFAAGNKFKLFTAGTMANSFTTVSLPPPGSGLGWANNILTDGSIEVVTTGEPTTPPTLSITKSIGGITLSWPTAYTSFALRGQTNSLAVGLTTHWAPVSGVVGNQITIPVDPAKDCVFFQLFQR